MRIALITLLFLSLNCYCQIDMALFQTGRNEELKTFYLKGEKLKDYLVTLETSPIVQQESEGEYSCFEKVWFSYEGNFIKANRVCQFENLHIKPFLNDLIQAEISIEEIIGHKQAVIVYDSLKSQNVNFQVSPSINSKNKFELREMAYFEDTLDPNVYSPIEMDSIYIHDYYFPAYSKLRKTYNDIDSLDFIFSPWIGNDLIVVIYPTKEDLNLKPFRKLGIQFKETPIIKQRKYRFTIIQDKV